MCEEEYTHNIYNYSTLRTLLFAGIYILNLAKLANGPIFAKNCTR